VNGGGGNLHRVVSTMGFTCARKNKGCLQVHNNMLLSLATENMNFQAVQANSGHCCFRKRECTPKVVVGVLHQTEKQGNWPSGRSDLCGRAQSSKYANKQTWFLPLM
jgi:hypothetical protein